MSQSKISYFLLSLVSSFAYFALLEVGMLSVTFLIRSGGSLESLFFPLFLYLFVGPALFLFLIVPSGIAGLVFSVISTWIEFKKTSLRNLRNDVRRWGWLFALLLTAIYCFSV